MTELYVPAFETQTDQNAPLPWTNCTLASGAMLVDWWSYGRIDTDDIALRRASGVHTSLGVNFASLRTAIKGVANLDLLYSEWDRSGNKNLTWAILRDHLASFGGAVVAGKYSALRPFRSLDGKALDRWQPGGDFGHATFVCDYRPKPDGDGAVLWMDPLGRGSYHGDRIPLEALWAFIYKSGNGADAYIAAAHGFSQKRPDGPPPPKPADGLLVGDWLLRAVTWTTGTGPEAGKFRAAGINKHFTQPVTIRTFAEQFRRENGQIVTPSSRTLLARYPDPTTGPELLEIPRTSLDDPRDRVDFDAEVNTTTDVSPDEYRAAQEKIARQAASFGALQEQAASDFDLVASRAAASAKAIRAKKP